jgi:folate-dependent tRNA-U54 methylase TrmFO/GidA
MHERSRVLLAVPPLLCRRWLFASLIGKQTQLRLGRSLAVVTDCPVPINRSDSLRLGGLYRRLFVTAQW